MGTADVQEDWETRASQQDNELHSRRTRILAAVTNLSVSEFTFGETLTLITLGTGTVAQWKGISPKALDLLEAKIWEIKKKQSDITPAG